MTEFSDAALQLETSNEEMVNIPLMQEQEPSYHETLSRYLINGSGKEHATVEVGRRNRPEPSFTEKYKAEFALETPSGSTYRFLKNHYTEDTLSEDFDPISYVPATYLQYADHYASARSLEEMDNITADLQENLALRATTENSSFFEHAGIAALAQFSDPINYVMPGGPMYKAAKAASAALKSASLLKSIGVGIGKGALIGAEAGLFQEAILNPQQRLRTIDESVFNVMSAAVLGGAIGGLIGPFAKNSPIYKAAEEDVSDVFTTDGIYPSKGPQSAGSAYLNPEVRKQSEGLANVPKILKKAAIGPYNKLVNSEFGVSREVANDLFQQHQILNKNLQDEVATQVSVENLIRGDQKRLMFINTQYEDIFLKQRGIQKGPFKATRSELSKQGLNRIEFDREVNIAMRSGYDSPNPSVKQAAQLLYKEGILEHQNRAIKLGFLEEGLTPKTAESWFPRIPNRQKIIQYRGDFEQFLFNEFKKSSKKTDDEIRVAVEKTINRMLGDDESRMLNPLFDSKGGYKPFKDRTLMIDDLDMTEWTIQDPLQLMSYYTRAVSPTLRLAEYAAEKFPGQKVESATSVVGHLTQNLHEEYIQKQNGKTPEERDKLRQQYDRDKKLIKASVEILQGIYGQGFNAMGGKAAKFTRGLMAWNYLRMMGSVLPASLADVGVASMKQGVFKTNYTLIRQIISPIIDAPESFKKNKELLQHLGFALNSQNGSLMKSFIDNEDLVGNSSAAGRFFDRAVTTFGNVSLINYWNNFIQTAAGTLSVSRTLSAVEKLATGSELEKNELTRLLYLGIRKEDATYIYSQFRRKGISGKDEGGYWTDFNKWNVSNEHEAQINQRFRSAWAKDIEQTLIEPTAADKPLLQYNLNGKVLLQFKSYVLAMTNKVLINNIQRRREAEVWTGTAMAMAIGATSYVINSYLRGDTPDISFDNLAKEAIDRSGVLGVFMEPYNIMSKIHGVPWASTSRYKSRGGVGAFLGPSYGSLEDIANVVAEITTANHGKRLSEAQTNQLIRFIPYQNLFYLYYIDRKIAHKTAKALKLERR